MNWEEQLRDAMSIVIWEKKVRENREYYELRRTGDRIMNWEEQVREYNEYGDLREKDERAQRVLWAEKNRWSYYEQRGTGGRKKRILIERQSW